jgi:hypothetical protein
VEGSILRCDEGVVSPASAGTVTPLALARQLASRQDFPAARRQQSKTRLLPSRADGLLGDHANRDCAQSTLADFHLVRGALAVQEPVACG